MKYSVKINDRTFEVEIQDLHARPVIAVVDGVEIEVWPEKGPGNKAAPIARPVNRPKQETSPNQSPIPVLKPAGNGREYAPANSTNGSAKEVRAPIPGVIVEVCVQSGAQVTTGQELCVLEAMKMKNSIRASRTGTILSVNAQVGQHVRHRDILMEYAD